MDFFFLLLLRNCFCQPSLLLQQIKEQKLQQQQGIRGNFYSHQPAPLVAKAQVGEPGLKPARHPGNPHAAHFLKDQPIPF